MSSNQHKRPAQISSKTLQVSPTSLKTSVGKYLRIVCNDLHIFDLAIVMEHFQKESIDVVAKTECIAKEKNDFTSKIQPLNENNNVTMGMQHFNKNNTNAATKIQQLKNDKIDRQIHCFTHDENENRLHENNQIKLENTNWQKITEDKNRVDLMAQPLLGLQFCRQQSMEMRIQQLQPEKRRLDNEKQELRQDKTRVDKEIQQLRQEKSQLENKNQQRRRGKRQSEIENQQLRQEKTRTDQEIQQLRQEKGQLKNENQQLRQEKVSCRTKISNFERRKVSWRTKTSTFERKTMT